jgi:[acyl-carrier-protein] S-malonyltransferase
VPRNKGGMVAVLGVEIKKIEEIIENKNSNYSCFLANDNSDGQVVVSGKIEDIENFIIELKKLNIKNIKLPVSAPLHCPLMKSATNIMSNELSKINFSAPKNMIVSNVTAEPSNDPEKIRDLLIKQIEKPVRWRESVINMIKQGNKKFIEIGPGKVLSGLIKRIDRNVELIQVNNIDDLNNLRK